MAPQIPAMVSAALRRHNAEPAAEMLAAGLSNSELHALLVHVLRQRAANATWPQVAATTARAAGLFRPSAVDARRMVALDARAFASASAFEAVDLSPVNALGANALAGIDQNNVLSATRFAEVVADPSMALAAECAQRRQSPASRNVPVRLAASHRLIRMQPITTPGFTPHFRLFCLTSAARDTGDERTEAAELFHHLQAWLTLILALKQDGHAIAGVRVELSDTRAVKALLAAAGVPPETLRGHLPPQAWAEQAARRGLNLPGLTDDPAAVLQGLGQRLWAQRLDALRTRVADPLRVAFPSVRVCFDLGRLHALNYYDGPAMHLIVLSPDGREWQLGDGGFTPWTQRWLNDRKERFLGTALGTELLVRQFPRHAEPPPTS